MSMSGSAIGPDELDIQEAIAAAVPNPVFGADITKDGQAELAGNGLIYTRAARIQVPEIVAGAQYWLTASFLWGYNATSTDFRSRLLINGTAAPEEAGFNMRQEPKDVFGVGSGGTDQRHPAFMRGTFGLDGQPIAVGSTPTFELQVSATSANVLWVAAAVDLTWMRAQ